MHLRHQRAHLRIQIRIALEMFEHRAATHQRARHAILYAEFCVERGLRIRAVGVRQPARGGIGFDARDIFRSQFVLPAQFQHRINRSMRARTTRILFVTRTRIHDIQRLAPTLKRALEIKISGAVIQIKKSLLVFKRVVVRGKTLARQQCGHQSRARALSRMKRLGHGAEIGLGARRQRSRDRQRGGGLRHVQPQQARTRGGHGKHAQRGCRMPADFIVVQVDRAADARAGLETQHVRAQHIATACARHFGRRQQRGNHRRRGVAEHGVGGVVVIERVRGGAVDQRGVQCAHTPPRADDQTRPGGIVGYRCFSRNTRAVLDGARERDAQRIQQTDLAPVYGLRGQHVIARGGDQCGKPLSDARRLGSAGSHITHWTNGPDERDGTNVIVKSGAIVRLSLALSGPRKRLIPHRLFQENFSCQINPSTTTC